MIFEKVKLSEVCKINSSKRIYLSEYVQKGIPFYRSKEIIEKSLKNQITTKLYISKDKFNEFKKKFGVPIKGDILITAVGTLGRSYLVKNEEFYFKDGNLIWFSDFNNKIINNIFLLYLIKTEKFQNMLDNISIGSTQKALTINSLKNIEIKIYTLENQTKIAHILSTLDAKIQLNNDMNNNLLKIQKKYFKNKFDERKDYTNICLKDVCEIFAGGDAPIEKSNNKTEKYTIPIISNGIANEGVYGYTNTSKIKEKSVTISARGTIGYKVLRNYEYYPIVRLISIIPKEKNITAEYIFYILENIKISGTGTTQQQLTIPMIKELKIKVHNKKLIDEFTNFSICINKKIDQNKKENETLINLRDTLLPKLMNGEIDLDNLEL